MSTYKSQVKISASLEDLVEELSALVDSIFELHDTSNVAEESRRAVLGAFTQHQDGIKRLFVTVEQELGRKKSSALQTRSRVIEAPSVGFWKRVVGLGAWDKPLEHSGASILSIILSKGSAFLLTTWNDYLRNIGFDEGSPSEPASAFNDALLPFPPAIAEGFFTGENAGRDFYVFQHKFCQVPSKEIDIRLSGPVVDLRAVIAKLKMECVHLDEKGATVPAKANDFWIVDSSLKELTTTYEHLAGKLYVASANEKGKCPKDNHQERREYYEELQTSKKKFLNGLRARVKILAILIEIKTVTPDSNTWEKFVDICCTEDDVPPVTDDFPRVTDDFLPLDLETVGRIFGNEDSRNFYHAQFRFCPVHLQAEKDLDWLHGDENLHLPLSSKRVIGAGAFGKVYRVDVANGYAEDMVRRPLAMKIVDSTGGYVERRLSSIMSGQDVTSKGIMTPLGTITAGQRTYIFMPLATCDLSTYMTTERPEGPKDFEDRLRKLRDITHVVRAIAFLHRDLLPTLKGKQACVHGDLKASNILFTATETPHFKIADFGISFLSRLPKAVLDGEHLTWTPRHVRFPLALGEMCPNFPPEAEEDGFGDARVDIWGFGTVFSEYVAWLAEGRTGLEAFKEARKGDTTRYRTQSYFTEDGKAKIKHGIEQWYLQLISRKKEGPEKELYRSCWNLIQNHLLRCEARDRFKIEEVEASLNRILEDGQNAILQGISPSRNKILVPELPAPMGVPPALVDSLQSDSVTNNGAPLSRSPFHLPSLVNRDQSDLHEVEQSAPWSDRISDASQTGAEMGSVPATQEITSATGPVNVPFIPNLTSLLPTESSAHETRHSSSDELRLNSKGLREALGHLNGDLAATYITASTFVDFVDSSGNTPLHGAVKCPSTAALDKLIAHHRHLIRKRNSAGQTALHKCVQSLALQHARKLLDADNTLVMIKDEVGRTPLKYATDDISNLNERNRMVAMLVSCHRALASARGEDTPKDYLSESLGRWHGNFSLPH